MTTFLGLDLGSTTIKGAVLDLQRCSVEAVRMRSCPDPVPGLPPSHFEIDPHAIVTEARVVLEELLGIVKRVEGLVVCSQMGGVLLCDDLARPLTQYLSWRDQRLLDLHPRGGGAFLDELRRRTTAEDLAVIGQELRPGSAVSLLFWLSESGRLPDRPACALNVGDYVVAKLGNAEPKTEPTLALGTLNLRTGQLHDDWLNRLGLGQVHWPELTVAMQPAGLFRAGNDAQPIPIYPAIGDQQAALLGAELEVDELSLNISTGSQVSLLTDTLRPGSYQTRPYFDGRFLNTITHLPAGRSLNALVDLLAELALAEGYVLQDPWSTISRAVEQTSESDLDVNLAFFAGTMGDRGHIGNVQLQSLSVGKLFRAAFQNMADNYAQCAQRLSPAAKWRRVVLSGGLPQKVPSLREMIAERFACPIRSVDHSEETLAGLLRLARKIRTEEGNHKSAAGR